MDCEIEIKHKRLFRTVLKKQGLLFDLYAWFLLWEIYNWDFEALSKKTPDELSVGMIYTGALSYCKDKGIRVTFKREDVEGWIDDIPTGKMKEIGRVLMDSMKVLEPIQAAGRKVEKKK